MQSKLEQESMKFWWGKFRKIGSCPPLQHFYLFFFFYLYLVQKMLLLDQILVMKILLNLHILRSPESKNHEDGIICLQGHTKGFIYVCDCGWKLLKVLFMLFYATFT